MSRRAAIGLGAGAIVASVASDASAAAMLWSEVDGRARTLVRDGLTPGIALSVMWNGRFLYSRGFGFANLETQTPVSPTSVFKIGSVTKQFTAAALLLLAEDGKLSIDDTLSTVLPDFPRAAEITFRQMLNHTSGLGNYTDIQPPEAFLQAARRDYDGKSQFDLMTATQPLFIAEPGTGWAYSNTAYVLLGLVIAKLSGVSYGEFYRRRLFDRAGLRDTAVDLATVVAPRRVSGYTPNPAAATGFDNASFISMTFPGAAGSIRSTSEDLCRWHAALLRGRILRPESLRQMLTPGRLKDGTRPVALVAAGQLGKGAGVDYGFGLLIGPFEGRASIDHQGGINGFASELRSFPSEGVTMSVLLNTDGNARLGPFASGLMDALVRAAFSDGRRAGQFREKA
jgi:CubicO group peptidase (beta-lactamase class C family)